MPKRVLVFYKKSAFQDYFQKYQAAALRREFRAGDANLSRLKKSHSVHHETLGRVKRALEARGVRFQARARGERWTGDFDLVVSVGGDGTFLEAARRMRTGTLLGVNSDPAHSVGQLCGAGPADFEAKLDAVLTGRAKVTPLYRLRLKLDGRLLPVEVLNDFLVSHVNPAAISHYVLRVGRVEERHRSSGIWISTAAGSTGAVSSAGAKPLPIDSRRIIYMPRELYHSHGERYRLTGGVVGPGTRIRLRSLMREGRIYADGAHYFRPFGYGAILDVLPAKNPLDVVFR